MRSGFTASVIGHLVLIAWGVLALVSPSSLDLDIEAIPVDFIQVADATELDKGSPAAQPAPTPAVNSPAPEPIPAPKPEPLPKPAPEPTPLPPPPPQPEPQPAPEPTPPSAPEPAPTPEPQPTPEPAPAETAIKDPVPVPRVRPKPPKPTPAVAAPKQDAFKDQIAAILDKPDSAAPAAPSEASTSLGTPTGGIDTRMTISEIDALKARIKACYILPLGVTPGVTTSEEVYTIVLIQLNEDGTIAGTPSVIQGPAGRFAQTAPEAVIRAILQCAPYALPPEKYAGADGWNQLQLDWDASKFF